MINFKIQPLFILVNHQLLKPLFKMPKQTKQNDSVSCETDLCVVKDIIDYKLVGEEQFYLIWWEGYTKAQSTWEPIQNIKSVEDDGWDLVLQECKRRVIAKLNRASSKTKQICLINGKERYPRRKTFMEKSKLHEHCAKFADYLVREGQNFLAQFSQQEVKFEMKVVREEQQEQSNLEGGEMDVEEEVFRDVEVSETQSKEKIESYGSILTIEEIETQMKQLMKRKVQDQETKDQFLQKLRVKRVKNRVRFRDSGFFYGMEFQNIKNQLIYMPKSQVKYFWPEELNKFNCQRPIELDFDEE